MAVRWYVAYSLRYRDVEEMMLERGISVDHSTVNRWVIMYGPQLEEEFRRRNKRTVTGNSRMDETYLKWRGKDFYLYRAVDRICFFCKAISQYGFPEKITMDKSVANKSGIDRINLLLMILFLTTGIFCQIAVRQIKYLNNIVEQDHRGIKKITNPMMGFKSLAPAKAAIAGIEFIKYVVKAIDFIKLLILQ